MSAPGGEAVVHARIENYGVGSKTCGTCRLRLDARSQIWQKMKPLMTKAAEVVVIRCSTCHGGTEDIHRPMTHAARHTQKRSRKVFDDDGLHGLILQANLHGRPTLLLSLLPDYCCCYDLHYAWMSSASTSTAAPVTLRPSLGGFTTLKMKKATDTGGVTDTKL